MLLSSCIIILAQRRFQYLLLLGKRAKMCRKTFILLLVTVVGTIRGLTNSQIEISPGPSQGAPNEVAIDLPDRLEVYQELSPALAMTKYGYEQLFGPVHAWMNSYAYAWDTESFEYLNRSGQLGVCALESTRYAFSKTAILTESANISDIDFVGSGTAGRGPTLLYVDAKSAKLRARLSLGPLSKLQPYFQPAVDVQGISNVTLLSCAGGLTTYCVIYSPAEGTCVITTPTPGLNVTKSCTTVVPPQPTRVKLLSANRAVVLSAPTGTAVLYAIINNTNISVVYQRMVSGFLDVAILSNSTYAVCTERGLANIAEANFCWNSYSVVSSSPCSGVETYGSVIALSHNVANMSTPRPFITEFLFNETSSTASLIRQYNISVDNVTIKDVQLTVDSTYIYINRPNEEVMYMPHSLPQHLSPAIEYVSAVGPRMAFFKEPNSPYSRETKGIWLMSTPTTTDSLLSFYSPYTATPGSVVCQMSAIAGMRNIALSLNVTGIAAKCPSKVGFNTVGKYVRSMLIRNKEVELGDTDNTLLYALVILPLILVFICVILVMSSFRRSPEEEQRPQPVNRILIKQAEEAGMELPRSENCSRSCQESAEEQQLTVSNNDAW